MDIIKSAMRPVRELYGSSPAREFGPLALEAVRQRLIATGRSRSGINGAIGRVRRVFRWGVSKELIPPSVSQALATMEGLRKGTTSRGFERAQHPSRRPKSGCSARGSTRR